jgi:hypothetical protein
MFLLLALLACTTDTTGLAPPCVPDAPVPDASPVAPGETVRLVTHPLADSFDTTVFVGSAAVEVVGVAREGCEDFDDCVADEDCSACGDCDACGPLLAGCVESVRVRVPEVAAGAYEVTVYSKYGESAPGILDIGP